MSHNKVVFPSIALLTTLFVSPTLSALDSPTVVLSASSQDVALIGPDAACQLVITLTDQAGHVRDVTHEVRFSADPKGVVSVDSTGYVTPHSNGQTTITARIDDGANVKIGVVASSFETRTAISFPNDIVPHLTHAGCNGGACHGTPKGQNNFRLSLLGFEPQTDYEFLTRESRGRRIFPASPERSLLLGKATGELTHGGGVRMHRDSLAYKLMHRWISTGLPYGGDHDATVQRIEIFPTDPVVQRGATQQLVVTALFSDGTSRDITRVAQYKANQEDMCDIDDNGLVTMKHLTGTAAVMVRFQEHVGAFTATIPLGAPMQTLPQPTNFIDERIFAKLKTLGLPPSQHCDEATFVRRVCLDIAGRLPTVKETNEFLASDDANKRTALIDALLNSDGYVDLFANKWAGILRNKAGGNLEQVARETYGFHDWIRDSLRANKPFDQFASELITARGKPDTNAAVSWYRAVSDPNQRMSDIAQVFLGVRIQCAQCHHHPYEKWSQDDYHGFAAFFSTLGRKEVRKLPEDDILYHRRVIAVAKNPNTGQELRPKPLDGQSLDIPASRDPRTDLAQWMTDPSNPFFPKVLVNRYWKHFFGRGLVESEDDIRVTNPATHPELLNELAEFFVTSGYDLKHLCRTICISQTYQLSSFPNGYNEDDEQNFARYYPRRLAAEVMLDAINDVAGTKNNFNRQPVGVRAVALPDESVNNESFFLRVFGRPQMDIACECERSASADLAQSLTLLNSDAMHRILNAPTGLARQLAEDKERDDRSTVTELYLHALSRTPTVHEMKIALDHVKKKKEQSDADPKKLSAQQAASEAYEDIIWVVVNTKEFLFNH